MCIANSVDLFYLLFGFGGILIMSIPISVCSKTLIGRKIGIYITNIILVLSLITCLIILVILFSGGGCP
jgi:hypothetical protein